MSKKNNNTKPSARRWQKKRRQFTGGFRFPDQTTIAASFTSGEWFVQIEVAGGETLAGTFKSIHYALGYLGDQWRKRQLPIAEQVSAESQATA